MASDPPTFALPPGFLGLENRDRNASIVVAGVPLDIGTSNRAGSRFGPRAIRDASRMLADGDHPTAWISPAKMNLADIGDFAIALGDIPQSLKLIEEQAAGLNHLVAFGGEHGITLPLLRALAKRKGPLALIQFDAHVDTWPENFGQVYSHGAVFYHAIEEGLVDPRRMIQIGIRSTMQREVYDWTIDAGCHHRKCAGRARAGAGRCRGAHPRGGGGGALLSDLRYRRARSSFRARHRHAGDRRAGDVAGASHHAPAFRLALRRHGRGRGGAGLRRSEITALAGASLAYEYLALVASVI